MKYLNTALYRTNYKQYILNLYKKIYSFECILNTKKGKIKNLI